MGDFKVALNKRYILKTKTDKMTKIMVLYDFSLTFVFVSLSQVKSNMFVLTET